MFIVEMKQIYGGKYLNRIPTPAPLSAIEDAYRDVRFPWCVDGMDYMNIFWKNCRLVEKGQYHIKKEARMATIVTEGWCDGSLYIWS